MLPGIPPRHRFPVPAVSVLWLTVWMSLAPDSAQATFHLIDINEVYTNAQGDLQFVELKARAAFQTALTPTRVEAYNADSTVAVVLFDFVASFPALDNNETLLLATAAFQDSAGFAPDFVMAAGVFFPDGRVTFRRDPGQLGAVHVDAVAYGNYTGANSGGAYGTPAAPLPSDGIFSLTRVIPGTGTKNNSIDFEYKRNSPTRNDGTTTTLHPASGVDVGLPREAVFLGQNEPNPTRGETSIPFRLEREAQVILRVYGVEGRLVRTIDAGRLGPGPHRIAWDGRDASRAPVAGGVYVYRLSADDASAARRMILVK